MVLKPSSNTPLSSLLIAEVLRDAGLPSGVLNVVPGSGGELGPALVAHPACSTVTLTGSTASGVEVAQLAAPRMAKCLLELGGKAPVLVAADADLDWAARATVWARFWNAGQACIAAEKCYVDASVAPKFLQKVTTLTQALRVGPGSARGVDMGPLYSSGARDAVARLVTTAEQEGARLVVGGPPPRGGPLAKGAFYLPTLMDQVEDDQTIAREEIFGPVLPGTDVHGLGRCDRPGQREPVRTLLLRVHARPGPGRAGRARPPVRRDLHQPGRPGDPSGVPRWLPTERTRRGRDGLGGPRLPADEVGLRRLEAPARRRLFRTVPGLGTREADVEVHHVRARRAGPQERAQPVERLVGRVALEGSRDVHASSRGPRGGGPVHPTPRGVRGSIDPVGTRR